ncbi:GHKL domain-containing protein [bacterium 1xD8-6]|nr:GHKL domain-containing protein [bacterium D16-36]RKI72065.1 GHKL domain-containing protein [bacterium 1xD8-6]
MVYFKDISYMLSHAFFMAFIYLFLMHRYSRKKTLAICFLSFNVLNLLDFIKLNLYPDSALCYFAVDLVQILTAQATGIFISRKRDSRALFIGLSASNYVIVGSITASILYIYTDNVYLALSGNFLMHLVILLVLFLRIGDIFHRFYEWEFMKGWWELCLIPVFFFSSFSCLAFFPYTLYELPENILVSIFLMITMLVSYVVVLRYMDSKIKQSEEYWKNVMFESYIKGLESQHYLVEQSERNLKILRHDMRHYSMIIDSLLDQGEYDEIRNIAAHINEVVVENKVARYCENLIVNTILLKMTEQAQSFHIDLRMDVRVPREIPVNEYEFALVLANLLENAINSVKDLGEAGKYVTAKVHCTAEYLLIDMENECGKEISFNTVTGLPESGSGRNHGLGLQSVKAFSEKLGGNIDCYCEKNRFRIILFVNF